MKNKTILSILGLGLASSMLVAMLTAQTPKSNPSLTPPGAPADGVFKTLDQVEPRIPIHALNTPAGMATFTITAPGSYYLTGDHEVASGSGITITADNVTLDLSGFTISSTSDPPEGAGVTIHSSQVMLAETSANR